MKKILLGTTAMIGAATLFAGAAFSAEVPKVTVGGFADFQVGFGNDDLDSAQRSQGFRNDTEINFNIDGKMDNGIGYGAVVDLEADVTGDADGEGTNASRTYLYLEGSWGRVEMGSNTGAEQSMKVDASNIARATGGIDGDWYYFANSSTMFIAKPDLPLGYGAAFLGDETQDNVNKITYYSPRFSGFQVGVSYSPDSTDRGQTVTRIDTTPGASGDNFGVGVNYQGNFSGVGVNVAATGIWGDGESATTEDLGAWQVGGSLGYMGFSVAASYGDWDDSLRTSSSLDDSNYWTLGAAYETGPFGVSLTYINSQYDVGSDENEFDNIVLGADYKLAEGLTPYVEVSWYDQDAVAVADDNDGTVGIVGMNFAF